ncbi:hypothetical protein BDV98DRAFT_657144 [Pterulicium gracile]|uniref:Uncharacterized protein n=1 Tax=Pterulicium gracile TaxID=1884261 RepID=A0A5C3QEP1_9AGAR|nr:hypothetical protein BDV98DRAFT_657144 [Pterula gracilis]
MSVSSQTSSNHRSALGIKPSRPFLTIRHAMSSLLAKYPPPPPSILWRVSTDPRQHDSQAEIRVTRRFFDRTVRICSSGDSQRNRESQNPVRASVRCAIATRR